VTAFLIESHKTLRLDPAEESVQLLRLIAAQPAVQNSGAEPRIISIFVNIFWFLSLVLSLTAALIGIVSLQWIRTHLRTLSNGSESLGLSHMHSLGLQNSYIPLVFTSLPVILILGLTFFLVGLIMFLFDLSWPVAIPAAIAIVFTYAFLITTTLHPALQSIPGAQSSDNPNCFPSPYRSPQSLLFLPGGDWRSRSRIWLRQRQEDFGVEKKQLNHLVSRPESLRPEAVFAYDTIEALISIKESRSAESEKERTALAKCLAEVLPVYLGLFPTGDLADLIPFLPLSEFVPSALFSREGSATREVLDAVALVQIASCKGQPSQTSALVKACVLTTRWLFEQLHDFEKLVPNRQPLHLISEPGMSYLHPWHRGILLIYLGKLSPDVFEVLIGTLTRFFTFAVHFDPEIQSINKSTHTSSYTYWFLVLSAEILIKCSLSAEMQARHAYLLAVIAARLDDGKTCDYLVLMASIYASIISKSKEMCSSPLGGDFLRAVTRHRDRFKGNLNEKQLRLHKAVKANEVTWVGIDRALEALRSPSTPFVPNSAEANDTMGPLSSAYDGDLKLGESGGGSGDRGESPPASRERRLCLTRLCSHTRWYRRSWRGLISQVREGFRQFLWIWEKFGR